MSFIAQLRAALASTVVALFFLLITVLSTKSGASKLLLLVSFIGIAVAAGWIAVVSRQLGRSQEEARSLAARLQRGDLAARFAVNEPHADSEQRQLLNRLLDQIQGVMNPIGATAEGLSAEVRNLIERAERLAQNVKSHGEQTTAVASTMEQMAASISSVAQFAEEVRVQAEKSQDAAVQGNVTMSELIGEISLVETAAQRNADAVREFLTRTGAITEMTQQVKSIADQTNLLALNAAIEAARAGEQGRGFAVVADEVRNLAVKSAQSTNEIDRVTSDLSRHSGVVEQSITDGLNSLKTIEATLENLSVVLHESRNFVSRATEGMNQISVSVQEQTHASDDLARNMDIIACVIDQNSKETVEVVEAARNIGNLAEELARKVRETRVV